MKRSTGIRKISIALETLVLSIVFCTAPNGKILLVGQILYNANGTIAVDSGRAIFTNADNGAGKWTEIAAPAAVANPFDNYCPNYSSALLSSIDGGSVFEIATDYDGNTCKAYFARGAVGK